MATSGFSGRMKCMRTTSTTPNPRLQRTRSAPLRSPLSRKPLGAARAFGVGALTLSLAAAVASCRSSSDESQFLGVANPTASPVPTELIASIQLLDPWSGGVMAYAPPFAKVFSDGTVVYSVARPAVRLQLMTAQLRPDEIVSLRGSLARLSGLSSSKEFLNLAPGTHDLPSTEVGLLVGRSWKVVHAYGLMPDGLKPAAFFATAPDMPPDRLPKPFTGLHRLLSNLRVSNAVP